MDASRNYPPLELPNNFQLHDFIDDPNFDQFIDLIRGENEDVVAGFDYDLINGCFVDKQISSTPGDAFGFDATSAMVPDPNYIFDALSSFDGEIMKNGEEDNNDEEENSSGATTTTTSTTATATKKAKVDRSRTLIIEQRRRGRMKEKLYALRSLVPNITKVSYISVSSLLLDIFLTLFSIKNIGMKMNRIHQFTNCKFINYKYISYACRWIRLP